MIRLLAIALAAGCASHTESAQRIDARATASVEALRATTVVGQSHTESWAGPVLIRVAAWEEAEPDGGVIQHPAVRIRTAPSRQTVDTTVRSATQETVHVEVDAGVVATATASASSKPALSCAFGAGLFVPLALGAVAIGLILYRRFRP